MNKFNLKYLVIAVVIISVLMITGALIFSSFNKVKPTPKQSTAKQAPASPTPPVVQSPTVSSFSAVVKEVKNEKLLIETRDEKPQSIEIPLDKNVTFEDLWVYKDGKNKPPTRQSVTSADLKVNQNLNILKAEVSNKQPIYEITILNQ